MDLRSDTLTQPSPAMKEAMMAAPLGDDVFGEDPTVIGESCHGDSPRRVRGERPAGGKGTALRARGFGGRDEEKKA